MTTPQPTGVLNRRPDGSDLFITRDAHLPIDATWQWITHPDKTAAWVGAWRQGDGERRVDVHMAVEEAWAEMEVVACERPRQLRLVGVAPPAWDIGFELSPTAEGTKILFVHRGIDEAQLRDIGPGWEFYLDCLVAALTGAKAPAWDAYPLGQSAYYDRLSVAN
ncbi:hypothetical protein CAPI_06065 [Corynebacterium capitovis DSM 44611]|uniref:SRPBCC domain-containing protein n=1 Tax=Corynebacterium capitovis TaxID=131081 RepID=UPI0003A6AB26|nr:SRPBCC domain-containing protein [Corynebacterium capitovis]WKD57757.1 hypothetical protein CAPI_06065 [Corynebacterium capitovis DSM 44611]